MLKSLITSAHGGNLNYSGNLPWNFNLENVGAAVNYRSILQHWPQLGHTIKCFMALIYSP